MLEEAEIENVFTDYEIGRIRTYDRSQLFKRFKQLLRYLGPAFIVSVAYIDPRNTLNGTELVRTRKPVFYRYFPLLEDFNSVNQLNQRGFGDIIKISKFLYHIHNIAGIFFLRWSSVIVI
ncbi:MAG: Divalent metal cation transporter MntH [Pelotomaculum sp. PtaB.Bin013]|nr:MAG: Divalent metal cation transporter MntH [Pelotomaculum sp. PtaB.Bin013]